MTVYMVVIDRYLETDPAKVVLRVQTAVYSTCRIISPVYILKETWIALIKIYRGYSTGYDNWL